MIHAVAVLCAALSLAAPRALPTPQVSGTQESLPQRELCESLSPRTLLYVEGEGLAQFIAQGLEHPLIQRILSSQLGDAALANLEATPEATVEFLEGLVGLPLFETASSLVSEGIVLGVEWQQGRPLATVLARSDDRLVWPESIGAILRLASSSGDLSAEQELPVEGPGDSELWRLGNRLSLGHLDGTFVASSSAKRLDQILRAQVSGKGTGLGSKRAFASAREARDPDALLWAWMNLAGLRDLENGKYDELYRMPEHPAVQMLFGSAFAVVGRAREWTSELLLDESRIRWSVTGLGIDAGASEALLPLGDAAALVMPKRRPSEVARLVAYRDLAATFAHRADLFPSEVLPAFSKLSNDLGPLLGGLDLGEDVLPGLSPWIRVLVREVEFDADATPELPLPAFVLLVDLERPDDLGPLLTSAFQTAVGLFNLERSQQGKSPMLLFLENQDGLELTGARFLKPGPEDGVDAVYNLVPACTRVGATFVLGSHVALVREVAEQLRDEDTVQLPSGSDRLRIFAPAVRRVVRANYDALVMNAVLTEGKRMPEARAGIDALLGLVNLLRTLDLSVRYDADATVQIDLELELAQ